MDVGTSGGTSAAAPHSADMDVELVRWQELVRRAGSATRARRWLRDGMWWRVFHDVYAPIGVEDGSAVRAAALRRVLPGDVAISHRAALWVLGLDLLAGEIDVTAPRLRRVQARPGVTPHSALLDPADLCEVGGLLVVSAARAVVDVARAEPLIEAVAVADAVLRSGAATEQQLADVLSRSGGLRGVVRARTCLSYVEPRSESLMETRLRMRFVLGGIRGLQVQRDLYDDDGHLCRADGYIEGVVVEYDGREARLDPAVFVRERRRQNRIADAGCELRRFTAADYYRRPAAAVCADLLRAVVQAAGRDRSRVRFGPDTLRRPLRTPLPTLADLRAEAA